MPTFDIDRISDCVRTVAREELLPRFNRIGHEVKPDGSLLTEADLAMHRRLGVELGALYPDVRFLSEEMTEAEQHALLADPSPLWCIDPLDGTSNFAAGIPFFGVSLALLRAGSVDLGIIYDPIRDELFRARRGGGADLNGEPLHPRQTSTPLARAIALLDLKRLAPELRARLLIATPFHSQRNFGSCALEWGWLAAGRGHVYLHGGQKLWDFAAGQLILAEAGGQSITLQGERVFQAALAPRSVVASPYADLFDAWRDWLGIARQANA